MDWRHIAICVAVCCPICVAVDRLVAALM